LGRRLWCRCANHIFAQEDPADVEAGNA